MKKSIVLSQICLLAGLARATVQVAVVQGSHGLAVINYECTAGEEVRAFALDVTVNHGVILGVGNFFRGECRVGARGYGIFPAAFRDHITVTSGTNANWDALDYTPLAVVADSPTNTLPGLNSSGVTLEFGGLWNPNMRATIPPASGTLCTLQISEAAQVSITANGIRGGVVAASSDLPLTPVFVGAFVDPVVILPDIQRVGGEIIISFQGGELETAPAVSGPWTGTGNSSGTYTNLAAEGPAKFYRVHYH
jgi:hypothetical protein